MTYGHLEPPDYQEPTASIVVPPPQNFASVRPNRYDENTGTPIWDRPAKKAASVIPPIAPANCILCGRPAGDKDRQTVRGVPMHAHLACIRSLSEKINAKPAHQDGNRTIGFDSQRNINTGQIGKGNVLRALKQVGIDTEQLVAGVADKVKVSKAEALQAVRALAAVEEETTAIGRARQIVADKHPEEYEAAMEAFRQKQRYR